MDGVQSVEQLDDRRLSLGRDGRRTTRGLDGGDRRPDPDRRIAWKSIEGAGNAGAVLFDPIGDDRVRVTLRLEAEPDGPIETVG